MPEVFPTLPSFGDLMESSGFNAASGSSNLNGVVSAQVVSFQGFHEASFWYTGSSGKGKGSKGTGALFGGKSGKSSKYGYGVYGSYSGSIKGGSSSGREFCLVHSTVGLTFVFTNLTL